MRKMGKTIALLGLTALFCLTATGCSFRLASAEELFSLPQLPAEYTELEKSIQSILQNDAEYAAPRSGTNTQPVQMVDLNGDGQEEALVFVNDGTGDKPLKIYIFTPNAHDYEQTAVIEGSGTAIYSINYNDLDQDGRMELLVGWQLSNRLQALTVYTMHSGQPEELMQTPYVKYAVTDLNQDDRQELVVLRADAENNSIADYYTFRSGALDLTSTARISTTMAELSRIKSGQIQGGTPALFVTGVENSATEITDVLTDHSGELTNITLSDDTGVTTAITRFRSLYPTDINGDGVTEVPSAYILPNTGDQETEPCYRIDWLSYDAEGKPVTAESTYHDSEDGWYLVLAPQWSGKILVTRTLSGTDEASVTFAYQEEAGKPPQDFLRIYTFTGNSREIKAVRGNRFILSRQTETIYSGELLSANAGWTGGLTEADLRARFSLITTEWLAGDN